MQFSSSTGITQDSNAVPTDGLLSVSVDAATNRMTTAAGWDYDRSGNLIRGQNASGVWQRFEYDAASRLKKVKDDSGNDLETYSYGAGREKLIVGAGVNATYYVWGGSSIIAEYVLKTGNPLYAKLYFYAGSRLLMTIIKGKTFETTQYHHPDRLGTQLVTETFSGTSYRQTTLPFGTSITAETTGNSNQVFTSYDRSSVTGLDYAVNRTYSQGQSRFTQVDPIGMSASSLGDPQSNNLYAYVQNMPTDFVDPTGLVIFIGNTWCGYVYVPGREPTEDLWDWQCSSSTSAFPSPGTGYSLGGSGGAGGGGYDFQKCAKLRKTIANLEKSLQKQKEELLFDIFDLPDLPPWPGAPRKTSRSGHVELIDQEKEFLKRRQEEYDKNCSGGGRKGGGGGAPSTAPTPFRVPVPGRPPRLPVPGPIIAPVRPVVPLIGPPPIVLCRILPGACPGINGLEG